MNPTSFYVISLVVAATSSVKPPSTYEITGLCPEDNNNNSSTSTCTCTSGILDCSCANNEYLIINRFNETDILGVKIQDCDKVIVHPLAFKNLSFEFVYFGNLKTLLVDRLAFFSTFIDVLELTNISDFRPKRFAFSATANITSVFLQNVRAVTIPRYFLLDAKELTMLDSSLGIVQSYAFMMIQNVYATNCKVDVIQSKAFYFLNPGENFLFEKLTVMTIEREGLHFGSWQNVTMIDNAISELQSSFLIGKRLENFNFSRNAIESGAQNSFRSIHASNSLAFCKNRISLAEPFSLPTLLALPEDTWITGNVFSCDCELSWLWKNPLGEEYEDFMNSNYCTDYENTYSLSQLVPVNDSDGVCLELVAVSTTTEVTVALTTTSIHGPSTDNTMSEIKTENMKNQKDYSEELRASRNVLLFCILVCLFSKMKRLV